MSVNSDTLKFCAREPNRHLCGIFADAETVGAVLYTDAPYPQAVHASKTTSNVHYKWTCH